MANIVIQNLKKKSLAVSDLSKPVLFHLQQNYIDWMHACGGKGRCTTCKAKILAGLENLAPMTEAEERYAAKGLLKSDERLMCQAKITGDVTIEVLTENQLPHMTYSVE